MIKKLLFCLLLFAASGCASAPTNEDIFIYSANGEDSRAQYALWYEKYKEGHNEIFFPYDLAVSDDFAVTKETCEMWDVGYEISDFGMRIFLLRAE